MIELINYINLDTVFITVFGIGLALSLKRDKVTVIGVMRMICFAVTAAIWVGDVACHHLPDGSSWCPLSRLVLAGFSESFWVGISTLFTEFRSDPMGTVKKITQWKK